MKRFVLFFALLVSALFMRNAAMARSPVTQLSGDATTRNVVFESFLRPT